MKADPMNSFLDFNGNGKIDVSENFMCFMMFQEIIKDEDDETDTEADDET